MESNRSHLGHAHFWARPITRRTFLGSAAIAGGAAATAGMWLPQIVAADKDELATVFPRPIPGGVSAFWVHIHHYPPLPLLGSGPINEPSAITDFNGIVGITRVIGSGIGTNIETGAQARLSYQVDNGFNTGLYVGEDGQTHHGSFAFIWMDLFTGAVGSKAGQVHDFNPGTRPSGLFWIQPIAEHSLQVDLQAGTAVHSASNLVEEDFGTLFNSITGGSGVPASVSFKLTWTAAGSPMNVTDSGQGFTGRFRLCTAAIEWSATAPNFSFISDSSSDVRSVIGRERNGIFFSD